jgi:hypothetical protein
MRIVILVLNMWSFRHVHLTFRTQVEVISCDDRSMRRRRHVNRPSSGGNSVTKERKLLRKVEFR